MVNPTLAAIRQLLADSHKALQSAEQVTAEMETYHRGYQAALMELAQKVGLVPEESEAIK